MQSSLETPSGSVSVVPCGQLCVPASLHWGLDCRPCSPSCGTVSHGQLSVTDQGEAGMQSNGTSPQLDDGGAAGVASGCQMEGRAGLSIQSYSATWSEPWLLGRRLGGLAAGSGRHTRQVCHPPHFLPGHNEQDPLDCPLPAPWQHTEYM